MLMNRIGEPKILSRLFPQSFSEIRVIPRREHRIKEYNFKTRDPAEFPFLHEDATRSSARWTVLKFSVTIGSIRHFVTGSVHPFATADSRNIFRETNEQVILTTIEFRTRRISGICRDALERATSTGCIKIGTRTLRLPSANFCG